MRVKRKRTHRVEVAMNDKEYQHQMLKNIE